MRPDRSAVPAFQSTEPTTTEKAFIRRVLLDICSVPLFGRVSMMFMLHQFLVPRYFPLTLSASLTAIGWRHRRHMARHNINPHVARFASLESCMVTNKRRQPFEWLAEELTL